MTSGKRTAVIDGTFSIEEIEVNSTSRRKAAKTTRRKARKKVKAAAKPKTEKKSAAAGSGPIVLPGSPGIKTIEELQDSLAGVHDADSSVVIDASQVESIDTAALQLLAAFANSVREQSRSIEWQEPSSDFREIVELLDLSPVLGIGDKTVAEEEDCLCPVF